MKVMTERDWNYYATVSTVVTAKTGREIKWEAHRQFFNSLYTKDEWTKDEWSLSIWEYPILHAEILDTDRASLIEFIATVKSWIPRPPEGWLASLDVIGDTYLKEALGI